MSDINVLTVTDELQTIVKKFRFRRAKDIALLMLEITRETPYTLKIDETFENIDDISEIADELPDFHARYLVLSYKIEHDDGRVQFPLCLVFWGPDGGDPKGLMLYTSMRNEICKLTGVDTVFELQDKDDLDHDWVIEQLKTKNKRRF